MTRKGVKYPMENRETTEMGKMDKEAEYTRSQKGNKKILRGNNEKKYCEGAIWASSKRKR